MPAVTADTSNLPRIELPATKHKIRPIQHFATAPKGVEGEGFPVRRAFAGVSLQALDPFVHMDQMGEIDYRPFEPRGTDWHPHRGFETVTYIVDGTFVHQDSHGGGGTIADGATQWMTAGRGILHIETPPESLVISGGLFHGIQLWVNLPRSHKLIRPAYQNLEPEMVTLLTSHDGGALVRLIAGEIGSKRGPGSTQTPITMAHATLSPGAQLELPWDRDFNALVYGLSGSGTVGDEARPFKLGQLAVLGSGDTIMVRAAKNATLDVLLLGGKPLREPVVVQGPFVMNTRAEVQQAFDDFHRGKLGTVPANAIHPYRRRR